MKIHITKGIYRSNGRFHSICSLDITLPDSVYYYRWYNNEYIIYLDIFSDLFMYFDLGNGPYAHLLDWIPKKIVFKNINIKTVKQIVDLVE